MPTLLLATARSLRSPSGLTLTHSRSHTRKTELVRQMEARTLSSTQV